jgi:hypothetical protein
MTKRKAIQNDDVKENEDIEVIQNIFIGKIKVKFHNTYIGKLGTYYKDRIYELPSEIYQYLKIDCEEVV